MTFQDMTSFKGLEAGGTVAVAGAGSVPVLKAAARGLAAGIPFLLVGEKKQIQKLAEEEGLDLSQALFEEARDPEEICARSAQAAAEGRAAVLMKGLVQTRHFIRSIIDKSLGLLPPGGLLSHLGLFADPRNPQAPLGQEAPGPRPFFLTDGGINIAPDEEGKKRLLENAVPVLRKFGISRPRIALLAPVETIHPRIPSTMEARGLIEWAAQGGLPGVLIDGPFGLDVALSVQAAERKGLDSPVAGRADLLLVPSLDAGNILYKAITILAGAPSAGILTGARIPGVLTSRSGTPEEKIASLVLALRASREVP